MESRIQFLDFLRALAIVFVLLDHLPDYKIPFLGIFSPYFGRFGVGLFIFVSGYLMFLTNRSFHSNHDILEFYKKEHSEFSPCISLHCWYFLWCMVYLPPVLALIPVWISVWII